MYVLVHTPTSPGSAPETTTFPDIDALFSYVKEKSGYKEPPTQADNLGLSTENRHLKGLLVDVYKRLEREFGQMKSLQETMDTPFTGVSPFNQATRVVPIKELRAFLPNTFMPTAIDDEEIQTRGTALSDLSGCTPPDFDPTTTRQSYMTDIFKPDLIPLACEEHDSESLLARLREQQVSGHKVVVNKMKLELLQNLFLETYADKITNQWPYSTDKQSKEMLFAWALFLKHPDRCLREAKQSMPEGLRDVTAYEYSYLVSQSEQAFRKYVLKDNAFLVLRKLFAKVIPANAANLEFGKTRSWEQTSCHTLIELYNIAEGKETKFPVTQLESWLQFFLDAEITSKSGSQIQSSTLYGNFYEYMERVAEASGEKTLFAPLLDVLSIQWFSKTMKDVYGLKTQRKSAGVFYIDIDYIKNGAGKSLNTPIEAADFSDLHREAKTESSWADAFNTV